MIKEKVASETTDVVIDSKSTGGYTMAVSDCAQLSCTCGQPEDAILHGKITAVKHTLIDKIKEGLDNGHNCDYICQLAKIYSNLSF